MKLWSLRIFFTQTRRSFSPPKKAFQMQCMSERKFSKIVSVMKVRLCFLIASQKTLGRWCLNKNRKIFICRVLWFRAIKVNWKLLLNVGFAKERINGIVFLMCKAQILTKRVTNMDNHHWQLTWEQTQDASL